MKFEEATFRTLLHPIGAGQDSRLHLAFHFAPLDIIAVGRVWPERRRTSCVLPHAVILERHPKKKPSIPTMTSIILWVRTRELGEV